MILPPPIKDAPISVLAPTLHFAPIPPTFPETPNFNSCPKIGILKQALAYTDSIPATGKHNDTDGDGNHKCDVCDKNNITTHTRAEAKEENRKEATVDTDGSYNVVYYCTECNSKLSESKVIIPAGTSAEGNSLLGASVLGTGSVIVICAFVVLAAAASVTIYFIKKKQGQGFLI